MYKPDIKALTDVVSTFSGKTYRSFDKPAGGSVTRYVLFDYLGTDTTFTGRYRTRTRAAGATQMGEWGAWIKVDFASEAQPNLTLHIWPKAFTYTQSDLSPATVDYAELEVQVKPRGGGDADYSGSVVFPVRYAASATATFTRTFSLVLFGSPSDTTAGYRLTVETDWKRNDSSIIVDGIWLGSAGGELITAERNVRYTAIVAGGAASMLTTRFIQQPQPGDTVYIKGFYVTCDGAETAFVATCPMSSSLCNLPIVTIVRHPEQSRVDLTVTDGGGASPITGLAFTLASPEGTTDTINLSVGQTLSYRMLPLDVDMHYDVVAMSADLKSQVVSGTLSLPSEGRFWFNWGQGNERSLCLEMSPDWKNTIDNTDNKTYFARATGYPAVFYGRKTSHEISFTGELFYPAARDILVELANYRGAVTWRGPYGEKAIVSIDSMDFSDTGESMATEVSIAMTKIG
ncbi:MAG: hypothetical protein LBI64_00635 [Coriobacteriales bacterium]|jgi:hypothetical protein|nr:hypothetical protein [Coriobacteriales bacterium]